MPYSNAERAEIIRRSINIFEKRLNNAIDTDTLNDFLGLFKIELEEKNPTFASYDRKTKILVFGALSGSKKAYIICAKKLNISEDNLEFVEWDKTKSFNIERLRYSSQYSDIICGPMPHSIEGISGTTSFIELIKNNPQKFPKMYNAVEKLSVTTFRQALIQTRFLEKFSKQ